MNCYIIYKTINQVNGKIYVGQHYQETSGFDGYLGSGSKIKEAFKQYGKDNFKREILEYCTSCNVCKREIYWIAELRATDQDIGYNITIGGVGTGSGENNPNFGKHFSEETIQKMSQSQKGRIFSEETIQKMSLNHADVSGENHPLYGKHHSDETKQKISMSRTGKYIGEMNYNNKYDYKLSNNQDYWSFTTIKERNKIALLFCRLKTNTIIYKGITITRSLK